MAQQGSTRGWSLQLAAIIAFLITVIDVSLETLAEDNLKPEYTGYEISWFKNPISYWKIRESLKENLVDPKSVQIEKIWVARIGNRFGTGYLQSNESKKKKISNMPDVVCVLANARNKMGG